MEANGYAKILAGTMGYNPNSHKLPIFWLCPVFGHANILVGQCVGTIQTGPKLI
jgi:hypothetical protein